jgi:hypothetical protein
MKTVIKSTKNSLLFAKTTDSPARGSEMVFTDLQGNSREFYIVHSVEVGGLTKISNSNFTAWLEDTPEKYAEEIEKNVMIAESIEIARDRDLHLSKVISEAKAIEAAKLIESIEPIEKQR